MFLRPKLNSGRGTFTDVFRLLTHAIDDRDRRRRLMFLIVPLLIVALALAAVAVWWLLGEGGLQIVLYDFGPAAITRPHQRFG